MPTATVPLRDRTVACISHPDCGEALSLMLFFKEFPTMAQRYPKYEARMGELLGKVLVGYQAKDWDTLNHLFQTANPGYHVKTPFPILSPEMERTREDGSTVPRFKSDE